MGCCSSGSKAASPHRAAQAPTNGDVGAAAPAHQAHADGLKFYVERSGDGDAVSYKFYDVSGNPAAKFANVVGAGADAKYPLMYHVSILKATGVGTLWEQPSGRAAFSLEDRPLDMRVPFKMLQLKDGDTGTILYTTRLLPSTTLVDFQCDIYKGDFPETSDARYLRLYKFRAEEGEGKRALKNAKDGTLVAWGLDPEQGGGHFRMAVAPGFEANVAAGLIAGCCYLAGE